MWWLGDMRAHWEQVFGPRTWTWLRTFLSLSLSPYFFSFFFLGRFFTRRVFLVPIGANKDLGMFYPRNPRFDEDGRWMPRKEWPTELQ